MNTFKSFAATFIAIVLIGCGSAGVSPSPTGASPSVGPSASPVAPSESSGAPTPTPSPSPTATVAPTPTPTAAPTRTPAPTPTPTMIVRAYFLMEYPSSDASALVPVLRTVPKSSETLRAAIGALLAGPSAKERAANPHLVTMISSGTRLLSVKREGETAVVNLSNAFTNGANANARVSQLVYTVTQFASVKSVDIRVNGAGYADRVYDRGTYRDEVLPVIFVDRPAWGAGYVSGTEITGVANVFEAQFLVALRDAAGKELDRVSVTASCGSGCWGDFSVRLHYDVTKAQWGTLRVWDISESDSSVIGLRAYPVYLRPRRRFRRLERESPRPPTGRGLSGFRVVRRARQDTRSAARVATPTVMIAIPATWRRRSRSPNATTEAMAAIAPNWDEVPAAIATPSRAPNA